MTICKICNQNLEQLKRKTSHFKSHNISYLDYLADYENYNVVQKYVEQKMAALEISKEIRRLFFWCSPSKKAILEHLERKGIDRRSTSEAIKIWTDKNGGPWNKDLTKEDHPSIRKYADSRTGENNPIFSLTEEERRKKIYYWLFKSEEELEKIRRKTGDALKRGHRSGRLKSISELYPERAGEFHAKRMQGYREYLKNKKSNNLNISSIELKTKDALEGILKESDFEFTIYHGFSKGRYIYDFYLPEISTVIEVNGSYWHCDPRIYESSYFNTKKSKTAKELWHYDRKRAEHCLKNICDYFIVVWEQDIKRLTSTELKEQIHETLKSVKCDKKNERTGVRYSSQDW